jgi:hypothetical protein
MSYSEAAWDIESVDATICGVCLEAVEPHWPAYTRMALPVCHHTFHTACLAQWLIQAHTCPTCRRQVEAERREQRVAHQPRHDMAAYWTMDMVTSVQGLVGLAYRVGLLLVRHFAWSDAAVTAMGAIVCFNDTLRWVFLLITEYRLRHDAPRYSTISPVAQRCLEVMQRCALAQLVSIVAYSVFPVERAMLLGACVVELLTQYAVQCAWNEYTKRVSVDVTYVTQIE